MDVIMFIFKTLIYVVDYLQSEGEGIGFGDIVRFLKSLKINITFFWLLLRFLKNM